MANPAGARFFLRSGKIAQLSDLRCKFVQAGCAVSLSHSYV